MQFSSESTRGKDVLVVKPSTYWLLGFKDRDLEEEYLNDLVDVSKGRLYLGHGMCAFFIFTVHIVRIIVSHILFRGRYAPKDIAEAFGFYGAVFVIFLAGLISR